MSKFDDATVQDIIRDLDFKITQKSGKKGIQTPPQIRRLDRLIREFEAELAEALAEKAGGSRG